MLAMKKILKTKQLKMTQIGLLGINICECVYVMI